MSRVIAYKGKIGHEREDFCVNYIRHKGKVLKEMMHAQASYVKETGEAISCKKGCSYCCYLYVSASLQECEAIVYYLYQNESALFGFLQRYPQWRESLRANGDLFKKCGDLSCEITAFPLSRNREQALTERLRKARKEALSSYRIQNLPCPLLQNDLCSIYEVRPYVCAGCFRTTPREFCNPSRPKEMKVPRTLPPVGELIDCSFYYKPLGGPVSCFMPLVVHEILKAGFPYFLKIPVLQDLGNEHFKDIEVKEAAQAYLRQLGFKSLTKRGVPVG